MFVSNSLCFFTTASVVHCPRKAASSVSSAALAHSWVRHTHTHTSIHFDKHVCCFVCECTVYVLYCTLSFFVLLWRQPLVKVFHLWVWLRPVVRRVCVCLVVCVFILSHRVGKGGFRPRLSIVILCVCVCVCEGERGETRSDKTFQLLLKVWWYVAWQLSQRTNTW